MKKLLILSTLLSFSIILSAQDKKEQTELNAVDANLNKAYNEILNILPYLESSGEMYTDATKNLENKTLDKIRTELKPLIAEYKKMSDFAIQAEKYLQSAISEAYKLGCSDKEMEIIRCSGHVRKFISDMQLTEDRMYVAVNSNNTDMTIDYVIKSNESYIKAVNALMEYINADTKVRETECVEN